MNTISSSIFKYVPPARVDIILDERIAFTPPNRFKDEFDVHPQIKPVIARAFLRRHAKLAMRQYEKSLPRDQRPRNKKELRDLKAEAVEHLRVQASELAANWKGELRDKISKTFGVLCLSEVHDENLTWEESAEDHRGFVIEFDTSNPSFKAMGQLVRVEYVPHRPIYDPVKGAKGFWRQKVKDKYQHEREWRIIRRLDLCEQHQVDGVTIYRCPLPRATIKAVYFGLRCDAEIENRLRGALVEGNTQFYRTRSQ